jgi:predicted Zn-dependent peptidase
MENIPLYTYRTTKFKTNLLELYLLQPLSRETAGSTALLPHVLFRGSQRYPTKRDLQIQLDELYGAELNYDVIKRGELQIIKISLELCNENFLPEREPLLEQGLRLISEMIINPLFLEEYVEQEKGFLKKEIGSLFNNKYSYANERCFQEMCSQEAFGIYRLGSISEIEHLNREGLYNYYQDLLNTDQFYFMAVGAIDKEGLLNKIKEIFPFKFNGTVINNRTEVRTEVDEVKEVIEKLDIIQGKLSLGFRTGITRGNDLYYALLYYNGILGGFPHSRLFMNIREKESLAYYINSRIESTKGLMLISSGIDLANYQRVKDLILKEITKMRKGEFTEQDFDWTKKALINQLKSTADSNRALTGHYLLGLINGKPESVTDMIKKLENVNKDEIIGVANMVKLDTVYFLDKRVEEGA